LNPGRILITTFGFDDKKVQSAMRMLAYDRLVVVTGEDSIKKDSYKRLQELESSGPVGMDTVVADVFDFMDCLEKTVETIDKYKRTGTDVIVNFSGGTKVLSDAALLASFQKGVKAYHCDDEIVELPTIEGLTAKERLTRMQRKVILRLKGKVERKEFEQKLVDEGHPISSVQKAIRELKQMEFLDVTVEDGNIYLSGNDTQRYHRDNIVQ
jgi:hypothetical protein